MLLNNTWYLTKIFFVYLMAVNCSEMLYGQDNGNQNGILSK